MRSRPSTPEELETLFEDAFVMRDARTLAELFEERALLFADGRLEARGGERITQLAAGMWERRRTYVANSPRVLQVGDTALVLAGRSSSVAHRGRDATWRYAIAALSFVDPTESEEQ